MKIYRFTDRGFLLPESNQLSDMIGFTPNQFSGRNIQIALDHVSGVRILEYDPAVQGTYSYDNLGWVFSDGINITFG